VEKNLIFKKLTYGKVEKIDSRFSFLAKCKLMGLLGIFYNHLFHNTKYFYFIFFNILKLVKENNEPIYLKYNSAQNNTSSLLL
jgi:hypothetical protein